MTGNERAEAIREYKSIVIIINGFSRENDTVKSLRTQAENIKKKFNL